MADEIPKTLGRNQYVWQKAQTLCKRENVNGEVLRGLGEMG